MNRSEKVIELLTLTGIYQYYTDRVAYYGDDGWRVIYTLEDCRGNVYSWRSSTAKLGKNVVDDNGDAIDWIPVRLGGKVALKGTVSGTGEYKGVPQTYLSRCKILEIVDFGPTEEEYIEMKRAEQLTGRDCEVRRVRYSEYKNEYSNCETLYESFERTDRGCFISVLV